jgi:hypothetical protein
MNERVKTARRRILILLLVVTTSFGFIKQFKSALRSFPDMLAVHSENGEDACAFKPFIQPSGDPSKTEPNKIAYVTDRRDAPGTRPANEYFYDAQYGLAPYLLYPETPVADYFLLDFGSDKNLNSFCDRHRLSIIARKGSLALARPL